MTAREYYRSIKADREAWRESVPQRCMNCGRYGNDWMPLQVHEITTRAQAPRRWWHRCNALLLCDHCHSQHFSHMAAAQQLAVKLVADAENFDLDTWLRIKDPELKAPERVTLADVAVFLRLAGE